MRAFASSLHAWKEIERNEGTQVPHGLVFPLAVVQALGAPHGLELTAEEHCPAGPLGASPFDAIMISVLDSRCMLGAARHFARWGVPFFAADRGDSARYPVVIAGGQGLHNPLPFARVADVIAVGDAEDSLPLLLGAWQRHGGDRRALLAACSTIPSLYVPSIHDRREVEIIQGVAKDIGVTLRNEIDVSHNGTRRIEIARGCKYKCAFCSLGWRTPLRENAAVDVVAEIKRSGKLVHLQAGDAESHSGIDEIRHALRAHGGSDQGWTGRLDSLFENPDQTIPGQKRYAFGVEGVSHRLRAAVGKGYLTDERLIDDTVRFFRSIEGEGKGRGAWHIITGLPTQRDSEALGLLRVLQAIDDRVRRSRGTARNLSLHIQPFQPLPGTPMQWCAAGSGARRLGGMLRDAERLSWCRGRIISGRTDEVALLCSVLARADERGADLLAELAQRQVSPREAEAITGATLGALDIDAPLAWDFVRTQHGPEVLRRAYDAMARRLCEAK